MENKVILYDIKEDNGDSFVLRAFMFPDGRLVLEGQDFCETAKNWFGDEEYEYYYTFNIEYTNKLKAVLKSDNLLKTLVEFFSGEMSYEKFKKLCEDNDIKFATHVIQQSVSLVYFKAI